MVYGGFKNLAGRTSSEHLPGEAYNIAKNPKYGGYQHGVASIVSKFSDKSSFGCGVKSKIMSN